MNWTVPTIASRALLLACEQKGVDRTQLLERADLVGLDLSDREARIPFDVEQALWAAALATTGDGALGLLAAEQLADDDYGVLLYLGRHAATVGEALQRVARWFALVTRRLKFDIRVGANEVVFALSGVDLPGPMPRAAAEYSLAAVLLRMRDATGLPIPVQRVAWPFADPGDGEGERVFGCPSTFAQPRLAMVLQRSVWDTPVPGVDAALSAILERHAATLEQSTPAAVDLPSRVRQAIAEALPDGAPTIDRIGRLLGMSGRTLQRRLTAEGLRFSELVDRVRLQLAHSHLAQPGTTPAEAAFLLGFSDQSAFTRAFKRWTGETPVAWRRARRMGA